MEEVQEIELTSIKMNPYQPRRTFLPEEIEGLAQSIQAVGLIHPPVVRPLEESGVYELISGERRFRAAQFIGLKTIPVIIRRSPPSQTAQMALIENIQRVDLNPIEIATALRKLM